mmetsp:Transcript_22945/g.22270  ORF Transcript_22945/g.22270 Transcript_22945/m.22270 type:complete len:91 (+) Transcript_22945:1549-1821(+)
MNKAEMMEKHFEDHIPGLPKKKRGTSSNNDEGVDDYAQSFVKRILGKIINHYKTNSYNSADPNKKEMLYFSKHPEFLDYNKFWELKEQLR